MKRSLLLLIVVSLGAVVAMAGSSGIIFRAPEHQKIEVVLDGIKINHYPSKSVFVEHVRPGKHFIKITVTGRRYTRELREQILVKPFTEYRYHLQRDRNGYLVLRRIDYKARYNNGLHMGRYPVHEGSDYSNYRFPKHNYDHNSHYGYSAWEGNYRSENWVFQNITEHINYGRWDDDKLILAKKAARDHRLMSWQIKEIMLLFRFEATRLKFAKFAYRHVIDKENFYQVKMALQFESSKRDLNYYIYHYG